MVARAQGEAKSVFSRQQSVSVGRGGRRRSLNTEHCLLNTPPWKARRARHTPRVRTNELPSPTFLGIEGGGTRTVALLADADGRLLKRFESGPANFKLLTEAQFLRRLREVKAAFQEFPQPVAVAIGLAGARGEPEWRRIRAAAAQVWPDVPSHATHDLETALAAVEGPKSKVQGPRSQTTKPASSTFNARRPIS